MFCLSMFSLAPTCMSYFGGAFLCIVSMRVLYMSIRADQVVWSAHFCSLNLRKVKDSLITIYPKCRWQAAFNAYCVGKGIII